MKEILPGEVEKFRFLTKKTFFLDFSIIFLEFIKKPKYMFLSILGLIEGFLDPKWIFLVGFGPICIKERDFQVLGYFEN